MFISVLGSKLSFVHKPEEKGFGVGKDTDNRW
jgi:hypothetical protein